MEKKKIVISYKNLDPEIRKELEGQYPGGYQEDIIKIDKGNGDYFFALPMETEDTSYLVKIDVKVDLNHDDDDDTYHDPLLPDQEAEISKDDENEFESYDEDEDEQYETESEDEEVTF